MSRLLLAALAAALLVGCQSTAPRTDDAVLADPARIAQAEAQLRAREAALGLAEGRCAAPAWGLVGRVALSNGRDGGSGRIEWHQADGHVKVTLSAPVTRQSWTLAMDAAGAVLDGVPNGPLQDVDAARLLRTTTGWEIPVDALGCWLRGARAGPALGPATVEYTTDLQPLRVIQGGWTVEYAGWATDPDGRLLPQRISAQSGDDRVRLVVDGWTAG